MSAPQNQMGSGGQGEDFCESAIARVETKIKIMEKQLRDQNNDMYRKNMRKMKQIIAMISRKNNKKRESGMDSYMPIVIVVSVISLGIIGYLVYKGSRGNASLASRSTI